MKYKPSIIKSVISLTVLIILILMVNKSNLIENLNIYSIVKLVSKRRKYDELYFLIVFSLKPVLVVVPSSMLSVTGGTLFGPVKGFLINMIGFFLSGTIAFYLSRFLGKDFVDRIVRGKALEFDRGLEKNGFKVMFLLRLPPIFSYDIVSYTAGLTKIKYKDFILGSLIGVIPETICYTYMGMKIGEPVTYLFFVPILTILFVTIITTYIFTKSRHVIGFKQKI